MDEQEMPNMSNQDELVEQCFACPGCGERRMDWLVWSQEGDVVDCQTCGATYDPNEV